jgi:hypothetical protein
MGALTIPMVFLGRRVASADVLALSPRGFFAPFRSRRLAIVDLRDRSIPYLVIRRGDRVHKIPLDGAPFPERAWQLEIWRLPGIDKARAGAVAARAAQRMGEGIHHPDYDCGRSIGSDRELVADAYRAIDVDVDFTAGGEEPPKPLARVVADHDPVHALFPPDPGSQASAPRPTTEVARRGALDWIRRGIPRSLPWQRRGRR